MKLFKAVITGLLTVCMAGATFGQTTTYSKVKIQVNNPEECKKLMQLPVAVDHGAWKKNWFETDLSTEEIQIVKNAGFTCETIIPDVAAWYENRLKQKSQNPSNSTQAIGCTTNDVPQPTGFELGSMGGYFTYEEFIGHLDSMVARFPNLITAKQPISNFQTAQNRPIYWLKISDNPNTDEPAEPQVLYTAIHHAREPLGLSQLIFYMYFLLENYSTNTDVKNVVDNTEMYFVPMINPDGYRYNQTTNPNGGGMWRKNRRSNGGNSFGVDLNRNYSYEWGGTGSSGQTTSETYRGTAPFSEPETQAMKWFIENHTFVNALNYHTYADLLLFPWGYTIDLQCEDHDNFLAFTADMVKNNTLINEQSATLYEAAGDSDDWAYGDVTGKPKVLAMTPEVGNDNDGFWPTQDRIIPKSKEMVDQNLKLALIAGNYGVVSDNSPIVVNTTSGYLRYSIQRLGIPNGSFTITFTPISNLQSMGGSQTFNNLAFGQTVTDSVAYTLAPNILGGSSFKYVVEVNNGLFSRYDTISKLYGNNNVVFASTGAPIADWTVNGWGLSSNTFFSAPNSLADSPSGNYTNNSNTSITSASAIDLTSADFAYLRFKAKWDIERAYDYAQVAASTDGQNWIPLCGKYTHPGSINQDLDQPIYDGTQDGWVDEEINLNDYTGQQLYLRFTLVSDQGVTGNGIFIDNLTVDAINIEEPNSVKENPLQSVKLYPNPATDRLFVTLNSAYTYTVCNVVGQAIVSGSNTGGEAISTAGLSKGMYFITINSGANQVVKRFVKQ